MPCSGDVKPYARIAQQEIAETASEEVGLVIQHDPK